MNKHRIIGLIVLVAVAIIAVEFVVSKKQASGENFSYQAPPKAPASTLEKPSMNEQMDRDDEMASDSNDDSVDDASDTERSNDVVINPVKTDSFEGKDATQANVKETEAPFLQTTSAKPEIVATKTDNPANQYAKAYVIQLASFSQQASAEALVEQLQQKSYSAFVFPFKSNDKLMYRVYVGPQTDKQKLASLQKEIESQFKIKGIVTSYKVNDI